MHLTETMEWVKKEKDHEKRRIKTVTGLPTFICTVLQVTGRQRIRWGNKGFTMFPPMICPALLVTGRPSAPRHRNHPGHCVGSNILHNLKKQMHKWSFWEVTHSLAVVQNVFLNRVEPVCFSQKQIPLREWTPISPLGAPNNKTRRAQGTNGRS